MQSTSRLARWRRAVICIAFSLATVCSLGCERKPEDLEQWRNAQGGMEKMKEWAESKEESTAVRVRALQILIEQDQLPEVSQVLKSVKDEEVKKAMVAMAVKTSKEMWAADDYPKMPKDPKAKAKDGELNFAVGNSKAIKGMETAYFVYPHASDAQKKELQPIFAEWLSADHELRGKLSERVTLPQVLPMAGEKGFDGIMVWFESSKTPSVIADAVEQYGDDKTKELFTKAIYERAMKEHPNVNQQLVVIIAKLTDKSILPYLERAIDDPQSPGPLADSMMDTYIRIKGPAATSKLNELVTKRKDIMRSVAFTRLIELRGEAGVTQGATALPLEIEGYATEGDNTLEKDAPYMCNIIDSELEKSHKVKDHKPVVKKMLDSNRWPAQAIAIHCAEMNKWSDWKPTIEALAESKQVVPGWGEEGTTLGDIATQAAAKL